MDAIDLGPNRRAAAGALKAKLIASAVGLFDLEDMGSVVRAMDAARAEIARQRPDALMRQGWII